MAPVNYGRVAATPAHVRGHDNPTPVVIPSPGGDQMNAAVGDPKPKPDKGRPGLSGLGAPVPVPGIGDFGKPGTPVKPGRGGKKATRSAALSA